MVCGHLCKSSVQLNSCLLLSTKCVQFLQQCMYVCILHNNVESYCGITNMRMPGNVIKEYFSLSLSFPPNNKAWGNVVSILECLNGLLTILACHSDRLGTSAGVG